MKRIILFFIALISIAFLNVCVSQAQTVNGVATFPKDSTTNAQTKILMKATPTAILGNYTVGVYITPTSKSGTATVKCVLQGSIDNVTYFDLDQAADSVVLNTGGVVRPYGWEFENSTWRYYRVKAVGYGVGVTTYLGGLVLKRNE